MTDDEQVELANEIAVDEDMDEQLEDMSLDGRKAALKQARWNVFMYLGSQQFCLVLHCSQCRLQRIMMILPIQRRKMLDIFGDCQFQVMILQMYQLRYQSMSSIRSRKPWSFTWCLSNTSG